MNKIKLSRLCRRLLLRTVGVCVCLSLRSTSTRAAHTHTYDAHAIVNNYVLLPIIMYYRIVWCDVE